MPDGLQVLGALLIALGAYLEVHLVRQGKQSAQDTTRAQAFALVALVGGLLLLISNFWASRLEGAYREHTIKLFTGGDSFVYLGFRHINQNNNAFPVIYKGDNAYPVFDVEFDVENFQTQSRVRSLVAQAAFRHRPEFPVFTSVMDRELPNMYLPEGDRAEYIININSRNKILLQVMQLRYHEDRWHAAYRVVDRSDETILIEHVDPGFPLKDGKVPWAGFEGPPENRTCFIPDYSYLVERAPTPTQELQ